MRIRCNSYKDAERLSNLYDECHIERERNCCYLVVDKVKRRVRR
jgi:hypothetical protein